METLQSSLSSSHKKALIIVLICVIVVSYVYILLIVVRYQISTVKEVGEYPSSFLSGMSLTEKRATLLDLVTKASTTPLTKDRKRNILNEFGGSNTAQYNFTVVERAEILRALNGK